MSCHNACVTDIIGKWQLLIMGKHWRGVELPIMRARFYSFTVMIQRSESDELFICHHSVKTTKLDH